MFLTASAPLFASTVELINMPCQCGSNQRFSNVVTSDFRNAEMRPKVEAVARAAPFTFFILIALLLIAHVPALSATLLPEFYK